MPALIFHDDRTAGLKIAALTPLDRLVVALHRAGAGPITIVAPHLPSGMKRAVALGIPVEVAPVAPARERAMVVVASSDILVQSADVKALLEQGGRLSDSRGTPLPIGVLPPGDTPVEVALEALPVRAAAGVTGRVTDALTAREAGRELWASITSSTDGFVDRVFNRPCGRPLSKLLVHTPVSPNAVSLASVAIGLVAAACFAVGRRDTNILAALLFQLSAVVDCIDGDLARVLFKESPLGKWLDLAGDQVVHIAVFAALAVGLTRTGQAPAGLWLGLSAVLGAALSFAVVVRGLGQPAGGRSRLMQRLLDSATNRDFSVLVLVLACVDRLEWFLWMAAIGSHLFWITALALQLWPRPEEIQTP